MYKLNDKTIFLESKEFIDSLTIGSHKLVKTKCPFCKSKNKREFRHIIKKGHTLCRACFKMSRSQEELLGQVFGVLTVVGFAAPFLEKTGYRQIVCLCRCECGELKTILARELKSGNRKSCGCFHRRKGKDNPIYKQEISDKERSSGYLGRMSFEAREWKIKVKAAFGNRCFLCGSPKNVHIHHVESYKLHPELRYNVQNGVCLCKEHHTQYHVDFLGGYCVPATKESFTRYMEWYLCQLQNC